MVGMLIVLESIFCRRGFFLLQENKVQSHITQKILLFNTIVNFLLLFSLSLFFLSIFKIN